MSDSEETVSIEDEVMEQGDAPIGALAGDRLGRRPFAEALAAEILAAPAARGYVMGLTGAWGSGKTSILNMTVDALGDQAIVVQFNPWMFSGTEALVSSFFDEVGKQLDRRDSAIKAIAEKLAKYGRLLSPLASFVGAGSAVNAAADIIGDFASQPSVFQQRQELRALLEALDRRLVVIVDDVDRLRPEEVLDMVRLVRLVGDFPNTLYLLAFDRGRVEECLGEGSPERGRAYLEKIVQVTHDVPAARQPDVTSIFLAGLQRLVDTVPTGPLDAGDWQNIFAFVVRPLLATPRSVRRLLGSLSMTMRLVGDEVALADLIGIEAVRVLQPAMFDAVISVVENLSAQATTVGQTGYQHGRDPLETPVAPLFGVDPLLASAICQWLFPGARRYVENMHYGPEWEVTWRRHRKIASSTVFRFYLERQLPDGVLPARLVEEALERLTDRDRLQELLDALSPAELMDLIERMNASLEELPVFADELDGDPARVALPVLLDLLPRLPEETGMLTFSGSMVIIRAALRLLKRLPTDEARAELIRGVLGETRSLSARLILVLVAGHRKDIGAELVTADIATALEGELRQSLIELSPAAFAAATRTVRLADLLAESEEGRRALHELAEDNRVMLSLFVDSMGEIRARSMGAAAVERTKTLAWDHLATYFGEEMLVRRTAELMQAIMDDGMEVSAQERAAVSLAADYATGNRPETSYERMMRTASNSPPEKPATADDGDDESIEPEDTQVPAKHPIEDEE
ncbi:MAG TPA: P-loop NTPase fold protein [Acidimicrobiales bacterium]|nr:P-loop NTPase fold protein [Acidimicrobiales bacterium]